MPGLLKCRLVAPLLVLVAALAAAGQLATDEPLPSWREGQTKRAIEDFVVKVTKEGGPDYVPPSERIAVFDNDGTLWCERPAYFELFFTMDRIEAMAPQHPEWKETEPFKSVLAGDMKAALAGGKQSIAALVEATHAGMTTAEFEKAVKDWIATAKHPKTGKLFTEMTYVPMIELLAYMRDNGFKTFIVSGGGVDFMRPWVERIYGVPPEQVVGSRGRLKFEMKPGGPVLFKLPEIDLIDDGPGKPVRIQQLIGRRPIAAFGNSDGDLEMLQWTTMADGPRLGLIVHHTDSEREYAYDRDSRIGRLDKALNEAPNRGWIVMDMKEDWATVFAFQKP
jgi:phosphoglycolate phosphatase-like HAD superfamily hydrolase